MSPLRKIALLFLCTIATIPLLMSPAFLAGRIVIRKVMLSRLESSGLQTYAIPLNRLKWYTEGHELLIDGRMFDVKSIHQEGDKYVVSGLFDDDETELNHIITAASSPNNQDNGILLFKSCLGILAIIPVAPPGIGSIATLFIRYNFPPFVCSVADGFLRELIHPPDFLFIS
jgi:hypothetical protein